VIPAAESAATALLWGGTACYAAGAGVALRHPCPESRIYKVLMSLLVAGVTAFAFVIAERWLRLEYGPFLTLFEVLISNLFSLGFLLAFVFWRFPTARSAAPLALGMLALLGVWALVSPDRASKLPATYQNPWLWVHVGAGKLFLASCFVATGLAARLLVSARADSQGLVGRRGWPAAANEMAWQFLALAFVLHSFMLIAGAVWAQDAWGRYWDWDPLETWAFTTWLAMAVALHSRVTYDLRPSLGWWMMVAVFVLAFLTFFGVPFLSQSPHKGAV